jgi:hypothetical protein
VDKSSPNASIAVCMVKNLRMAIEVWFALYQGKRIAAVVVLRDGNDLPAKWCARVAGSPDGSSHLIFMAIAEQHAQRARVLNNA